MNRVEIDPDTELRIVRQGSVRLVTEEDAVRIYYNVDNTREYHAMEEQFLELDSDLAPAMEHLIQTYPGFSRAQDLPCTGLDLKMTMVQDLWEKGILMTRMPLESHYDD